MEDLLAVMIDAARAAQLVSASEVLGKRVVTRSQFEIRDLIVEVRDVIDEIRAVIVTLALSSMRSAMSF